jgi:hypothetical protein
MSVMRPLISFTRSLCAPRNPAAPSFPVVSYDPRPDQPPLPDAQAAALLAAVAGAALGATAAKGSGAPERSLYFIGHRCGGPCFAAGKATALIPLNALTPRPPRT